MIPRGAEDVEEYQFLGSFVLEDYERKITLGRFFVIIVDYWLVNENEWWTNGYNGWTG